MNKATQEILRRLYGMRGGFMPVDSMPIPISSKRLVKAAQELHKLGLINLKEHDTWGYQAERPWVAAVRRDTYSAVYEERS